MRTLNQVRKQDTAKLKRIFVPKTRKGNPIIYWPHLKEYRSIQNRAKLRLKIQTQNETKNKVKIEDKVQNEEEKPTAHLKEYNYRLQHDIIKVKVEDKEHKEEDTSTATATETTRQDKPIQLKRIKIEEI